jgi:hypothetical protein
MKKFKAGLQKEITNFLQKFVKRNYKISQKKLDNYERN